MLIFLQKIKNKRKWRRRVKILPDQCETSSFSLRDALHVAKVFHPEVRVGTLEISQSAKIRRSIEIDVVGDVYVGRNVIFSDYVQIFTHEHNMQEKDRALINRTSDLRISDNVYLGTRAIVTENCKVIGKNAVIAAGAVVTKSVPENEIWAGVPAKKIGDVSCVA